MSEWNKYRRQMRRAVKDDDYIAISSIWAAFQSYCEENGWPDWWSELQQAYITAGMLQAYGGR